MRLKQAILAELGRDELKTIVDRLDLADVDRRSVEAMRAALAASRRATPEALLADMAATQLKSVCRAVGVAWRRRRANRPHGKCDRGAVTEFSRGRKPAVCRCCSEKPRSGGGALSPLRGWRRFLACFPAGWRPRLNSVAPAGAGYARRTNDASREDEAQP